MRKHLSTKKESRRRLWAIVSLLLTLITLSSIAYLSRHRPTSKQTAEITNDQKIETSDNEPEAALLADAQKIVANKTKSAAAPGRQVYTITSFHRSPVLYQAVIDPEDVKLGQKQTMTVSVKEEQEDKVIKSVTAKIQTDNGEVEHDLKLASGTDQDGEWEGSWIVQDTHDTTYTTTFIAVNNLGETAQARLSWTDPGCNCTGQSCTISGSCTVSGVDGADGGTLTVSGSGNVTVPAGATLVYGATFNVSATVNVNNTAVVQGGNICMTDADSDNYPANTTQYAETSCGTNRRRRYLMSSITTTDCNDSNAGIHLCCWGRNGSCDATYCNRKVNDYNLYTNSSCTSLCRGWTSNELCASDGSGQCGNKDAVSYYPVRFSLRFPSCATYTGGYCYSGNLCTYY